MTSTLKKTAYDVKSLYGSSELRLEIDSSALLTCVNCTEHSLPVNVFVTYTVNVFVTYTVNVFVTYTYSLLVYL